MPWLPNSRRKSNSNQTAQTRRIQTEAPFKSFKSAKVDLFETGKKDIVKERNKSLTKEIKSIFKENKGRYGVEKIYNALLNKGYKVNHKRVQQIMHEEGLKAKCPKEKYKSSKGEVGKTAENIINRNFKAQAPLQKWTTDVSQFSFSWGKCYISPILDMYTNEIMMICRKERICHR